MQNTNTRIERLCMWIGYRLGGWGSPSLAMTGHVPTLRWCWTGRTEHAREDDSGFYRYVSWTVGAYDVEARSDKKRAERRERSG